MPGSAAPAPRLRRDRGRRPLIGARWVRTRDGAREPGGSPSPPGGSRVRGAALAVSAGGEDVVVHVAGEVRDPGVYRLPAGSRVADAVERAGGAERRAPMDAINLAATPRRRPAGRGPRQGARSASRGARAQPPPTARSASAPRRSSSSTRSTGSGRSRRRASSTTATSSGGLASSRRARPGERHRPGDDGGAARPAPALSVRAAWRRALLGSRRASWSAWALSARSRPARRPRPCLPLAVVAAAGALVAPGGALGARRRGARAGRRRSRGSGSAPPGSRRSMRGGAHRAPTARPSRCADSSTRCRAARTARSASGWPPPTAGCWSRRREPVADLPVGREVSARGPSGSRRTGSAPTSSAWASRRVARGTRDRAHGRAPRRRRRRSPTASASAPRRRWSEGTPEPQAALLRGFVLGQDDRIDPGTVDDFQRSGLAHLLAVSGQNVVLLALLAARSRRWSGSGSAGACWAMLALIAVYVPVAGAGAVDPAGRGDGRRRRRRGARQPARLALVRAAARRRDHARAQPARGGDVGWQLSFAAVIGIALVGGAAAPAARRGGAAAGVRRRAGRGRRGDGRGHARDRTADGAPLRAPLARVAPRQPAGASGGRPGHVAGDAGRGRRPAALAPGRAADRPRRASSPPTSPRSRLGRRAGVGAGRAGPRRARGPSRASTSPSSRVGWTLGADARRRLRSRLARGHGALGLAAAVAAALAPSWPVARARVAGRGTPRPGCGFASSTSARATRSCSTPRGADPSWSTRARRRRRRRPAARARRRAPRRRGDHPRRVRPRRRPRRVLGRVQVEALVVWAAPDRGLERAAAGARGPRRAAHRGRDDRLRRRCASGPVAAA